MHLLPIIIFQVLMTISQALPTTTSTTDITKPPPKKSLSLCCCCLANFEPPQPIHSSYVGQCSKAGVRDVCGENYTGTSGFALEGLAGQPDKIAALCSLSRCGAMLFVE